MFTYVVGTIVWLAVATDAMTSPPAPSVTTAMQPPTRALANLPARFTVFSLVTQTSGASTGREEGLRQAVSGVLRVCPVDTPKVG